MFIESSEELNKMNEENESSQNEINNNTTILTEENSGKKTVRTIFPLSDVILLIALVAVGLSFLFFNSNHNHQQVEENISSYSSSHSQEKSSKDKFEANTKNGQISWAEDIYSEEEIQIINNKPILNCNEENFNNWNPEKSMTITKKNNFHITKMPFSNLSLVLQAKDSLPDRHFTELAKYLETHPARQSIYIHSAPVYAVLLVGAVSQDNVTVIVSHDYPEKYLLRICFRVNGLQNLLFEQKGDSKINIERSDFVITKSGEAAIRYFKQKMTVLLVIKQEVNPDGFFKIKQQSWCEDVQLIDATNRQLDSGVYVNQLGSDLVKVYPQKFVNTLVQEEYIKHLSSRQINENQILQKITSFQLNILQKEFRNQQKKKVLQCKEELFQSWNPKLVTPFFTQKDLQIIKMPFSNLSLVLQAKDSLPDRHFTELVKYLETHPARQSIYIHSAPVYAVLLVGAVSPDNVTVIVSHDYPQKNLLQTSFILNELPDLLFEFPYVRNENIWNSNLLITQSVLTAIRYSKLIKTILILTKQEHNPSKFSFFKFKQQRWCSDVKEVKESGAMLSQGIYVISP